MTFAVTQITMGLDPKHSPQFAGVLQHVIHPARRETECTQLLGPGPTRGNSMP